MLDRQMSDPEEKVNLKIGGIIVETPLKNLNSLMHLIPSVIFFAQLYQLTEISTFNRSISAMCVC